MSARRVIACLAGIAVAGGCLGSLSGAPPPAQAEHPNLVAQAIDETLAYRTVYTGFGGGVLQVDAEAGIVTYDTFTSVDWPGKRIHFDGADVWLHRAGEAAPEKLPPEIGAMARDLWNEWRAGFAHATFVEESPVLFDPKVVQLPGLTYYRVDLPFSWASTVLAYVSVTRIGTFGGLAVYDAQTRKPLRMGVYDDGQRTREVLFWRNLPLRPAPGYADVPLAPETYGPERPERVPAAEGWRPNQRPGPHGEYSRAAWHHAQQFVRLVRADTEGGLIAGPQLVERCVTAPAVFTQPLAVSFEFPDDPAREDLARLATVDCPNPKLQALLTIRHHPIVGQRTCAVGQWSVVNTLPDPDVILAQDTVNACRNGPAQVLLEHPVELPLPAGSDPTGLEVRFTGEVKIECNQASGPALGDVSNVYAGFRLEDYPVLSWSGCYPGWP